MRAETFPSDMRRAVVGAAGAGGAFVLAHASLVRAGNDVAWGGALAFALTNGLLWLVMAPASMWIARRVGRNHARAAWQIAAALVCAPLFGVLQGAVAVATTLRQPVPPLASAFYYLDLNAAVLLIAALGLELYSRRAALARHARRNLALEARLLEVRHDLLTLQLQPHFLFNALNSVVELIREVPADAARVLGNLRTLFLATTHRSSRVAVSLADELEVVDAFIGIARTRHGDQLSFRREVDERALQASVPPLTLQPLIENAIRFALLSEEHARFVALRATVEGDRLLVRLTNSCAASDRAAPGMGIGLRNTRERLAHLFGADHSLTLDIAGDTAVAALEVPVVPLADRQRAVIEAITDPEIPAATAPGPPLEERRLRLGRLPIPALVVGFWTLAWVFWAFQMHFYRLARGITGRPIFGSAIADLISAVSWMLLTPAAFWLGRKFTIQGGHWRRLLILHVVAALACSAANVAAVGSIYGLSSIPINNVLNQAVVNCAIYALIVLAAHAERIGQWFDERQTATRRLSAELARARWDAMAMRLQPEAIGTELARLAALVERDPVRAEEGVLDMADALRRMLNEGPGAEPAEQVATAGTHRSTQG